MFFSFFYNVFLQKIINPMSNNNSKELEQKFQCSWTLYSDMNWRDRQKIGTVQTIRDFWTLFNYFPDVRNVKYRVNLSFFKKDVLPVWESSDNCNGGKWYADLSTRRPYIQRIWLNVIMGLVGETIDPQLDEVVGVTLHLRRPGDRIAVWTRTCEKDTQMQIGRKLRPILECDLLEFKSHQQALQHDSAYKSPSLYVVEK
jgi:translation initiation factor 4E